MTRLHARLRRAAGLAAALLLAAAAAGCDGGGAKPSAGERASAGVATGTATGKPDARPPKGDEKWELYKDSGQPQTLTVMYESEEAFYRDIGNLFVSRYPNVEFEVVDLSETRDGGDAVADYEAVLDKRKPDVLLMEPEVYRGLADRGRLRDLELPIRQSGFDLEGYVPGVLELLRDKGGGKLYGLSNTFVGRALYYNRSLFDKYGVPYPEAGITWEQTLLLAGRFPSKGEDGKPLYGLYQPTFTVSPFDLVQRIGAAGRLSALNADKTVLQYGSEPWRRVFQQVLEGYRSGAVAYPNAPLSDNGDGSISLGLGGNAFAEGRAAMAVDDRLTMTMMEMQADSGQAADFEWATIPPPVDPAASNVTSLFELRDIYGISRDTDQAALAWAFLEFVNGEEYAKLVSRSTMDSLARRGFERDARGRDLSAFYALGPDLGAGDTLVPLGFSRAFQKVAQQAIEAAMSGALTDEQALAQLVEEGQHALDAARRTEGFEVFDLNVFGSARAATGG